MLDDTPELGPPVPVFGQRGDLLLAHFLLGHNTGSNLGPSTRRMIYDRLGCSNHRERWSETFTDVYTEYPRLRALRPDGGPRLTVHR